MRLLTALLLPPLCFCDFSYPDFGIGAGLTFNGVAATSSCEGLALGGLSYHAGHGSNDAASAPGAREVVMPSGAAGELRVSAVASAPGDPALAGALAVFPQREDWAPASSLGAACAVRARLTPAASGTVGSLMRRERAPVLGGFEARFAFVVTDQSRTCVQVKDRMLGLASYTSCAVTGGDGLAFVVHGDPAGDHALGEPGSGLGYAGLTNVLAVEFDSWYNPRAGTSGAGEPDPDMLYDHIAVQAALPGGGGVGAGPAHRLGRAARAPIADGRVHTARVLYEPHLRYDLLPLASGSPALLEHFLKDAGEGRRLGMLTVFYDNASQPLIAMPLNLNTVLRLPDNRAHLGFTAATGEAWQKHDLLSWRFCEGSCEEKGDGVTV